MAEDELQDIAPSTLRQLDALSVLSDETIRTLAKTAKARRYPAGTLIVAHLDASQDFYLILDGCVRVQLNSTSGRAMTYQILWAGEQFGEIAALDQLPRTASVVAETDAVLIRVKGEDFSHLVNHNFDFAKLILKKLARMNRWLTERLFEYHSYDVRGRVYAELLRIAREDGGDGVKITDRDIASRVGTTRENVTRIHSELKALGLIERQQSRLRVLDTLALEARLSDCEFS